MMKPIAFSFWAALSGCHLAFACAAQAVTLTLAPTSTVANVGEVVSLDVFVADAVDLYAFQVDVLFTPITLSAQTVLPGIFLSGGPGFVQGRINNTTGTVAAIGDTLIGPVAGKNGGGKLFTIQFLAPTPGTAQISLANAILLDSNLDDIGGVTIGTPATVTVTGTPSEIPEPSVLLPTAILAAGTVLVRRAKMGNLSRMARK